MVGKSKKIIGKREKEAQICPGIQEFAKKILPRWPRFEDLTKLIQKVAQGVTS